MSVVYVGVDPGVSGGICAVDDAGVLVCAAAMPSDDDDAAVLDLLAGIQRHREHQQTFAVLERVHSSPLMGVASAFTFGGSYRALKMALTARGIGYDLVVAQRWQPAMGIPLERGRRAFDAERAAEKVPRKSLTLARAFELFPHAMGAQRTKKAQNAVADALLLAEYCRRLRTGLLSPADRKRA